MSLTLTQSQHEQLDQFFEAKGASMSLNPGSEELELSYMGRPNIFSAYCNTDGTRYVLASRENLFNPDTYINGKPARRVI